MKQGKLTTEMLERMGVAQFGAREQLLELFEGLEAKVAELEEALAEKDEELSESKKQAAVERAILEANGRNVRAILALVDMERVKFDGKELRGAGSGCGTRRSTLSFPGKRGKKKRHRSENNTEKKGTGNQRSLQKGLETIRGITK